MARLYDAYIALRNAGGIVDKDIAAQIEAVYIKQFTSGDNQLDEMVREAEQGLFDIAERANEGEITEEEFKQEYLAAYLFFLRASAAKAAGMPVDALPQEALTEINNIFNEGALNISSIASDIYNGRYQERDEATEGRPKQTSDEGKEKLSNRMLLWAGNISAAVSIGVLYLSEKQRWDVGPTEHCPDCKRLDGQVHTRQEWIQSGWRPRSPRLACTGRNCQCRWTPVKPDTPTRGNF